jgi:hypothetical protein
MLCFVFPTLFRNGSGWDEPLSTNGTPLFTTTEPGGNATFTIGMSAFGHGGPDNFVTHFVIAKANVTDAFDDAWTGYIIAANRQLNASFAFAFIVLGGFQIEFIRWHGHVVNVAFVDRL